MLHVDREEKMVYAADTQATWVSILVYLDRVLDLLFFIFRPFTHTEGMTALLDMCGHLAYQRKISFYFTYPLPLLTLSNRPLFFPMPEVVFFIHSPLHHVHLLNPYLDY